MHDDAPPDAVSKARRRGPSGAHVHRRLGCARGAGAAGGLLDSEGCLREHGDRVLDRGAPALSLRRGPALARPALTWIRHAFSFPAHTRPTAPHAAAPSAYADERHASATGLSSPVP